MTGPSILPVALDVKRPLWSVMIPVHNPDIDLLRRAIAGPLAADLGSENLQLALIDDADGSVRGGDGESFWRGCEGSGIEVHRFNDAAGIPANWNRCIDLSRGHFIHILHQDDSVQPSFYRVMESALQENPTIGASFSQHVFVDENEVIIRKGHLDRPAGMLFDWQEHVMVNLAIQCPAIVVRRAVYETLGGFDTSFGYCPDYDMWQRIAIEYPIWYDPAPLAQFRTQPHSASALRRQHLNSWLEVKRCRNAALAKIPLPARRYVDKSGRRHMIRCAVEDAFAAMRMSGWRRMVDGFAGAAANGGLADFALLAGGRRDIAPASRPPARSENLRERRLPRILLLTEFYPTDPAICVFGAFQRLLRHIQTLSRIGLVDIVFLWPDRPVSAEKLAKGTDMVRNAWPLRGEVRFVDLSRRRSRMTDRITDLFWALRGAVGFFHTAATMRTSGHDQATALLIHLKELQPDLIFAHRVGAAAPLVRIRAPLPPVIVDIDDLEHVKLNRLAASMPGTRRRLKIRAEAWLAVHTLRRLGKLADRLLVTSELDRSKLLRACRSASVAVIPNTAIALGPLARSESPVALFVGTAAYPPNREAIIWLMNEIWPVVRQKVPNAVLLLVGDNTRQLAVESPVEGIEGLDFVADLAPVYERATIAVCPVWRGGGTRIKIIEAALNSRPVVSTSVGAEGLAFEHGAEILIEDRASDFASACVTLLQNPVLASKMAEAAKVRAEIDHSSSHISELLKALCLNLLDSRDQGEIVTEQFGDHSTQSANQPPSGRQDDK